MLVFGINLENQCLLFCVHTLLIKCEMIFNRIAVRVIQQYCRMPLSLVLLPQTHSSIHFAHLFSHSFPMFEFACIPFICW